MFRNFEISRCRGWGVIKWKLEINIYKRCVSQFRDIMVWDVIRVWRVGCNQVKTAPSLEDNRCQIEDKQSADHWNSNMVTDNSILRKKLRQAVNVVKLWPASHSFDYLDIFIKAVNYKRKNNFACLLGIDHWEQLEFLCYQKLNSRRNSPETCNNNVNQ